MPSIRTLLTGLGLAALSVHVSANPVPPRPSCTSGRPGFTPPGLPPSSTSVAVVASSASTVVAVVSSSSAAVSSSPAAVSTGASPALPVNGGSAELPAPTASLKYVAIGRGIQNYTCANASATPALQGAIATLFDATSLADSDESTLNSIPAQAVYQPVPSGSMSIAGQTFPVLGNHFFAADGTPTFVLSAAGDQLNCAKKADIKAPSGADSGPAGTGAVDWLQLLDKGGSVGLTEVYRVETAGGNPTTCTAAGVISVQYSAEYWFYG